MPSILISSKKTTTKLLARELSDMEGATRLMAFLSEHQPLISQYAVAQEALLAVFAHWKEDGEAIKMPSSKNALEE